MRPNHVTFIRHVEPSPSLGIAVVGEHVVAPLPELAVEAAPPRERLALLPFLAEAPGVPPLLDVPEPFLHVPEENVRRVLRLGRDHVEHVLRRDGLPRVAPDLDALRAKLEGRPGRAWWRSLEELARVIAAVREPDRVGVCLDTCHLFAAGYDFRTPETYAEMIGKLESAIGVAQIRCIHTNDSKRELGSRVDRHEHIGKGHIGKSGFANFLNDPRFREVPFILETPKEKDEKGRDMDVINVKKLRSLID